MCTCGLALKDGAKVLGWQKPDSGIVGIRGEKGEYGWIKGDAGRKSVCGKWVKREIDYTKIRKIRGMGIKKPLKSG